MHFVVLPTVLAVSLVMRAPGYQLSHHVTIHLPRRTDLRRIQMSSEMEWRRRQELGRLEKAMEDEMAEEESSKNDVRTEQPNLATSVDDINFFGSAGGGPRLTREALQLSTRNRAPSIRAEEALQNAIRGAGQLQLEEAIVLLQDVIGKAYAANVDVRSPLMKEAAQLLAALEQAANLAEDAPEADPYGEVLNELFTDMYAIPELEDEEEDVESAEKDEMGA